MIWEKRGRGVEGGGGGGDGREEKLITEILPQKLPKKFSILFLFW